jgi:hypothetical protein
VQPVFAAVAVAGAAEAAAAGNDGGALAAVGGSRARGSVPASNEATDRGDSIFLVGDDGSLAEAAGVG